MVHATPGRKKKTLSSWLDAHDHHGRGRQVRLLQHCSSNHLHHDHRNNEDHTSSDSNHSGSSTFLPASLQQSAATSCGQQRSTSGTKQLHHYQLSGSFSSSSATSSSLSLGNCESLHDSSTSMDIYDAFSLQLSDGRDSVSEMTPLSGGSASLFTPYACGGGSLFDYNSQHSAAPANSDHGSNRKTQAVKSLYNDESSSSENSDSSFSFPQRGDDTLEQDNPGSSCDPRVKNLYEDDDDSFLLREQDQENGKAPKTTNENHQEPPLRNRQEEENSSQDDEPSDHSSTCSFHEEHHDHNLDRQDSSRIPSQENLEDIIASAYSERTYSEEFSFCGGLNNDKTSSTDISTTAEATESSETILSALGGLYGEDDDLESMSDMMMSLDRKDVRAIGSIPEASATAMSGPQTRTLLQEPANTADDDGAKKLERDQQRAPCAPESSHAAAENDDPKNVSAATLLLEQKRKARAERLAQIKERIRREKLAQQQEEAAQRVQELKAQQASRTSLGHRQRVAFQWYNRLARPSKAAFHAKLRAMPASVRQELSAVDIESLPWQNDGESVDCLSFHTFIANDS